MLQQSVAQKINVEILNEKFKKISVLRQQLVYEINDKIYFLQKPKKSASAVSCKISHIIQLKNLKYLPPQSLACEVYRKQENYVKDLLPQSRRTHKINYKMQQRLVKSIFSQSILREISDKMH